MVPYFNLGWNFWSHALKMDTLFCHYDTFQHFRPNAFRPKSLNMPAYWKIAQSHILADSATYARELQWMDHFYDIGHFPKKPSRGPAKRWVRKHSDPYRAGAADDMDVDTGGGVPANMYRVECAGKQDQYGQCWTNSLAHVLRATGQHEEMSVTGQDLRERLYLKRCRVYNELNPDAVDTFFKTMSVDAVNNCIQSLIRKEGGDLPRADGWC